MLQRLTRTPADAPPIVVAAHHLLVHLDERGVVTAEAVGAAMRAAFGLSDAAGGWTWRQAYDACEAAGIMLWRRQTAGLTQPQPRALLALAQEIAAQLPSQTRRSPRQIRLQQFSTPLPYAVVAATAAGLTSRDLVLEPSCGTGMIAAVAQLWGPSLLLNEIDEDRAALAATALDEPVSRLDAEFIDDLLSQAPSVVLMNPPFSSSFAREDAGIAGAHLISALKRLREGGRLVAIMPDGFSGHGSLRAAWRDACDRGRLRMRLRIPGTVYARHGTAVDTALVVFDRTRTTDAPIIAEPADLETALELAQAIGTTRAAITPAAIDAAHATRATPATNATAAPSRPRRALVPASRAKPTGFGDRLVVRRETAEPLRFTAARTTQSERGDDLYEPYRLARIAIEGAALHPTPLVQSAAMAAIAPPMPTAEPLLPPSLLRRGALSDAQLETVIYAVEAFARDLPGAVRISEDGRTSEPCAPDEDGAVRLRQGFFLGDGTGCGKGRQVAAIILDAWARGHRRALWISKSDKLIEDAIRDWTALGGDASDIVSLNRFRLGDPVTVKEGILFVTYATLRVGPRQGKCSRLEQIVDWLGHGFEGVVAFDEAHAMGGAASSKSDRGERKGSQQGISGLQLQNALPRARVLYVSATGASKIENLAYASRLGLWGTGDYPFQSREAFMTAMEAGGVAAMEVVARDLKALGLYTARALSFEGVEYDIVDHALTPEQIAIYDAYAEAFQLIHQNLQKAMAATNILGDDGQCHDGRAKGAVSSRFESLKQRFFNHLLIGMKAPSMLRAIHADLAAGRSVIVQIISTGEALMERRLDALDAGDHEDLRLDLTPREYVAEYLREAFPTELRRVCEDENGAPYTEIVTDEDGAVVESREACALRDAMIEALYLLEPVQTALDQIVWGLGPDVVAEATGRSRRIVPVGRGSGARLRVERRAASANLAETRAFMAGTKRVLVFSEAGGTGRSYHADATAGNRQRRVHYLLEAGWRADVAIQGLGRGHRSNQVSAPWIRLVSTDVKGEKRFISTIARRLDSLGALTRGAARTGGQNLFRAEDNLEGRLARAALRTFYVRLVAGEAQAMTLDRFTERTGLKLTDEDGVLLEELPPITRFLNRALAMRIAEQNAVFAEFEAILAAAAEQAAAMGQRETGVETIKADGVTILDRQTLRTCPRTGAETVLWRLALKRSLDRLSVSDVAAQYGEGLRRLRNARSGAVAFAETWSSIYDDNGAVIPRLRLIRPKGREIISYSDFLESAWEDWSDDASFEADWAAAVAALPSHDCEEIAMVGGLLLPIWNRLPNDAPWVRRVTTDCGQTLLGRVVPLEALQTLGGALGDPTDNPVAMAHAIMREGRTIALAEGARIRRRKIAGHWRCEIEDAPRAMIPALKAAGCFVEIIAHTPRVFVPLDDGLHDMGVETLGAVLQALGPVGAPSDG